MAPSAGSASPWTRAWLGVQHGCSALSAARAAGSSAPCFRAYVRAGTQLLPQRPNWLPSHSSSSSSGAAHAWTISCPHAPAIRVRTERDTALPCTSSSGTSTTYMHQRSTGSSQVAPIAPGQAVRHPRRCQRHRRTLAPPAAAAGATWSLQQRPDDHTRFSGSSVQRQLADTRYDAEIAAVALPALAGMLLEPTVGVINAAVVGQLGKELLGAVSVGSLAISFCTFLASFLMFLTTPEIAAAVGKDQDKVCRITARGVYVAGAFGVIMTVLVMLGADAIVAYLQPPEPAVAAGAIQFIRVRALGLIPALLGYVAVGVLRGHKDTSTPLYASVLSAFVSLALNALFLYGMKLGTFGCALATTLGSLASCAVMYTTMMRRGILRLSALRQPPSMASVMPMLRAGLPLSLRNAISFGMVLYASLLCVRCGSAYQAAFEVIRQVWILTIQSFECLNVSAQVLCSSYLGAGDTATARGILLRLLSLGTLIGVVAGVALFLSRDLVAHFFTADPAVIIQVGLALPLVAAFLPMDAVASIMDGSLMASKQTNFLSATQIAGAGVQYVALLSLASHNMVSTLSVWSCLKLLTLFRMAGGLLRNFCSPLSAYSEQQHTAAQAAAAAAPGAAAAPVAAGVPGHSSSSLSSGSGEAPSSAQRACTGEEAARSTGSWALDSMDADSVPCGIEPYELEEVMSLISSTSAATLSAEALCSSWDSYDVAVGASVDGQARDPEQALQMQEAGLEVDDGEVNERASVSGDGERQESLATART